MTGTSDGAQRQSDEFPVPSSVRELGGESGVLHRLVAWASSQGEAGLAPFTAVVVVDGVVVGRGANTTVADLDPVAHAEVTALRDAARRAGTLELAGATLYASCEPCALCRVAAVISGVSEIVFAAGREFATRSDDPSVDVTYRLMDSVDDVVPALVRRGASELTDDQLAAPFQKFAETALR